MHLEIDQIQNSIHQSRSTNLLARVFLTKLEEDIAITFWTFEIAFTEPVSSKTHVILIENLFSTAVKSQFEEK